MKSTRRMGQAGFTLIELLVVVLIIGILAAIAVPQYFKVVEKGRSAEAVSYLGVVSTAQEAYYAKNSGYAQNTSMLDITFPLKYFNAPAISAAVGASTWSMSLRRIATPAFYGQYSVSYGGTQQQPGVFGCGSGAGNAAACNADLMP